jgi:hypothetical protein
MYAGGMPIAWVSAESSTIPEQPPIEVAGCSGYTCHDEQDAMDAVWVVSTERRPMCHRLVEDDASSERHEYRITKKDHCDAYDERSCHDKGRDGGA